MAPKFDAEQKTTPDRKKVRARGPINWEPEDAGRKIVEMEVTFAPERGRNCTGRVREQDGDPTFDQGVHEVWEFEMPNDGMALGPVEARGKVKLDNGEQLEWLIPRNDAVKGVSIVQG